MDAGTANDIINLVFSAQGLSNRLDDDSGPMLEVRNREDDTRLWLYDYNDGAPLDDEELDEGGIRQCALDWIKAVL